MTLQRSRLQTIQLVRMTGEDLVAYAKTGGLDPKLRRAIARIGGLRHTVDQHQRRLVQLTGTRKTIFEEQKRIRDNINRVPRESDLYRRYLDKLNAQETELEEIAAGTDETKARIEEAREALARYIRGLKV